jgi:RTA1 like protein
MSLNATAGTYIICTLGTCPIQWAFVEYIPSLAGNATYLSIFVALWIAQLYLGIRYRTWGFLTGMVVGVLLEILGYLGRILLHSDPFNFNYFLVYDFPFENTSREMIAHNPKLSHLPHNRPNLSFCSDLSLSRQDHRRLWH